MEYYFIAKEKIDTAANEITVDGEEYNHLFRVLRKREGDFIVITDGELNIYECRVISSDKTKFKCRIENRKYNLFEPDIDLTLFIAPLRNISRFEFAVEKAVELGVKRIQPVSTVHTILKNSFSNTRMDRIRNIIKRATGQSQRCFLPEFRNVIPFDEMLKITEGEHNKIAMYEYSDDEAQIVTDNNSKDFYLLIGPEGGISNEEINKLTLSNWKFKSLGERKIRSETAAIVSVFKIITNKNYK